MLFVVCVPVVCPASDPRLIGFTIVDSGCSNHMNGLNQQENAHNYQLARMGEKEVRVRTRHENLKRASGSKVKGEGRYEVTRVEDMKEEQGVRKYLVKWKGHRERTWEKEGNLVGAEERVRQYWERRRRKRKGE